MSKKHFIALGDHIRANRAAFSPAAIDALAHFCREENPRFNESRWRDYIDGKCGKNGGEIKDDPA